MIDKLIEEIKQDVREHKILLYMKGTAEAPMCGFSKRALDILRSYGEHVETRNVLETPEYREALYQITSWPTIPQVFIGGEFIGGCDILQEMDAQGELKKKIEAVACK